MKRKYTKKGKNLRTIKTYLYRFFLTFTVFAFGGIQTLQAQNVHKRTVDPVICPAKFEDMNSRMAMTQMQDGNFANTVLEGPVTAQINVTFGPGATGNAEVMAAFQFAIDIWSREIVSSVPIEIFADFADLGAGVLASAGPTGVFDDFLNIPELGIFYPTALANSLAGEDVDPTEPFDLVVNLGNGLPFYFGTDGNTPPGQFDFVTIALHEIGHGLGFIDGGSVDANGVGSLFNLIFDQFVVDSNGNAAVDFANPSVELGDFYTSGDVFANGNFAVAALGGVLPELFAPSPFQGGSSIAHWDEATFPAGDPNSLMTPAAGTAESNFNIGDITRGHFRDMGWAIAGQAPIAVNPTSFSEELFIELGIERDIVITNISETDLVVTANPSEGAVVLSTLAETSINVPFEGTQTFSLSISTVGVPAGIYEESVNFTIEGFDVVVNVPVRVRVLDGTETPIIGVDPTSFTEVIEQLQVVTRDLLISNTGNEDLEFSITIDGEIPETFNSLAATYTKAVATNGFTTESVSNATNTNSLSSLMRIDNGTFERTISPVLAAGFEDFTPGDLDTQMGWVSTLAGFLTVSTEAAFEGTLGVRGTPDGTGAFALALSPTIPVGSEPFTEASIQLRIEGDDTNFEFIPQSNVGGSIATRIRFNADSSIDILSADSGVFSPIEFTRPEGFFNLSVILDRDSASMQVFIDNEIIFSGTAFTTIIDNIALLSDDAGTNTVIDFDNILVNDGADVFFLSASPLSGTIPVGENLLASVSFDARSLDPGVFTATINVSSNDAANPSIDIPVNLTVIAPPNIAVSPDSLSAAVNVITDTPPIDLETFTISNNGDAPLHFSTTLDETSFMASTVNGVNAVAQLDLSKYGVGNTGPFNVRSISGTAPYSSNVTAINAAKLANVTTVVDSIFYDNDVPVGTSFLGLGGGLPFAAAVNFDVEDEDFTLTTIRNAFSTEALTESTIILEIIRGGASPELGELLLQQTITTTSETGIFLLEELAFPIGFEVGESFWVVHKYPEGIDFAQSGESGVTNQRPDTYFFSGDGGASYTDLTGSGFTFLTRALSDGSVDSFITLNPRSGTVAPGTSVEVEVTFDGGDLANGVYDTDILINSNDPVNPTVALPTTFDVSGQINGIAISDELVLFNNVFVGAASEETLTITNTGLSVLNITNISSDNADFTTDITTATIAAGESVEVVISFSPSSVGNANGILTIESDGINANSLDVIINGVGVSPPIAVLDPTEAAFTLPLGGVTNAEFTLSNAGDAPLIYSFPDLTLAMSIANTDSSVNLTRNSVIDFEGFNSKTQKKGFVDSRIGAPIEFSFGTDLNFGYTWIDSNQPDGPVNNFLDISGMGTDITDLVGDDGSLSVPLSFRFPFYGVFYDNVFVNDNGFVSFTFPEEVFLSFFNEQIPVDDEVNNIIAALWTDLNSPEFGSIHTADFGDRFIIQWTNVTQFFGTDEEDNATFQIVLYDGGNIDIFYGDLDNTSSAFLEAATIGIENADGSDGALIAFNAPYVESNLALRFVNPDVNILQFITDISPLSGVVPVGGSVALDVTIDANTLPTGTFVDLLRTSNNAPDTPDDSAFLELTVVDIEPSGFTLVNPDTDEVIGALNDGDTINLFDFDANNFNVIVDGAEVDGGSVVFDFNSVNNFRTENVAPYALAGDLSGDFNGMPFPLGNNTITATIFTGSNASGVSGTPITVNFTVIDEVPEDPDTPTMDDSSFTLINADTNASVGLLVEGDTINLSNFNGNSFNIVAEADGAGSVVFDFNGVNGFRTENVAPFALAGDVNGDFNGIALSLGNNTVTATAYSGANATGTAGTPVTINFIVIDEIEVPEDPEPPTADSLFTLINAATNSMIGPLNDGDTVNLSDTGNSLNIVVEAEGAGSVIFDFNGVSGFRTENVAPFALAGDINGDFNGIALPLGDNTITATAYSGANGSGTIQTTFSVSFRVEDSANATRAGIITSGSIYPNPVVNEVNFTLKGGTQQKLTASLHNLSGFEVHPPFNFNIDGDGNGTFSMSGLNRGVYILRVNNAKGELVSQVKLLKQ